jgi:recombination protein RecT
MKPTRNSNNMAEIKRGDDMTEPKETLLTVIDKAKDKFLAIAPKSIQYEAEKGFAVQLLNNNQYLMDAARSHPASLIHAVTNVAAIGLSLNPAEKLAYLIPRSVKNGDAWQSRVFLEPSYMGLCKLATDTGSIEWVQAACVYKNDVFEDNGFGMRPTHKYSPFDSNEKRGEFVGVYCVAKTNTGDYLTTIMNAEDVYSIREKSESYKRSKKGVWVDHFSEQAKKTVVRRAFKMWPRSDLHRLAQAVELSNDNEGFEPMISTPEIRQYSADQKNYFDSMISKNDSIGMYVFAQTIIGGDLTSAGADIWTGLQHSFPKGEKGKYQKMVEQLTDSGESQFIACLDALDAANKENDKFAALEILQDLSSDCIILLKKRAGADVSAFIDEALKKETAA